MHMRTPARAVKMHHRLPVTIVLDLRDAQFQDDHADRLDVAARFAVLAFGGVGRLEVEGLQVHPVQETDQPHPRSCYPVGVCLVQGGARF